MTEQEEKVLRAFAMAAVLAGARLAQHDRMVGAPWDGPPDEAWNEWIKRLAEVLRPAGVDGALALLALTHIAEGAPDWLMYESAAAINAACGPVLKRSPGGPLGIVEYGNEEASCYPGSGGEGEADALRGLLDVTLRWSLRGEEG